MAARGIGARGGNRTRTPVAGKRILSPLRLPVSPPGQNCDQGIAVGPSINPQCSGRGRNAGSDRQDFHSRLSVLFGKEGLVAALACRAIRIDRQFGNVGSPIGPCTAEKRYQGSQTAAERRALALNSRANEPYR